MTPKSPPSFPYQTVLFDLDNTLYDYNTYWRQRLRWSFAPLAAAYPQLDLAILTEQAIQQRIYASRCTTFLQQWGITDTALLEKVSERYRINDYSSLQLYPETRHLLQILRRHTHVGLITNGPAWTQRPKIHQFALEPLLDVIIVSGEVQVAKPDPAIFALALEPLAVAPAAALYIGDSLEHDLLGAQAAGLDFIWMNPTHEPLPPALPQPRAIISSLNQMGPLLGLPLFNDND